MLSKSLRNTVESVYDHSPSTQSRLQNARKLIRQTRLSVGLLRLIEGTLRLHSNRVSPIEFSRVWRTETLILCFWEERRWECQRICISQSIGATSLAHAHNSLTLRDNLTIGKFSIVYKQTSLVFPVATVLSPIPSMDRHPSPIRPIDTISVFLSCIEITPRNFFLENL